MQSVRGAIEVRSKCAYGRPMVCALRAQLDGVQLFVMSFPAPRFRKTPGLDERVRQEADRRHDNSIACQMTGFVVVVGQDVVVRKAHDSSFPPLDGQCFAAFAPAGASGCHLVPRRVNSGRLVAPQPPAGQRQPITASEGRQTSGGSDKGDDHSNLESPLLQI